MATAPEPKPTNTFSLAQYQAARVSETKAELAAVAGEIAAAVTVETHPVAPTACAHSWASSEARARDATSIPRRLRMRRSLSMARWTRFLAASSDVPRATATSRREHSSKKCRTSVSRSSLPKRPMASSNWGLICCQSRSDSVCVCMAAASRSRRRRRCLVRKARAATKQVVRYNQPARRILELRRLALRARRMNTA